MKKNPKLLLGEAGVEVFSTCPSSARERREGYFERVADVAQWSEQAGCTGMLVYTDNGEVDPWLVAQHIIQNTTRLCPLVAIQPVYMHPYAVAKMVSSLGHLYGRRVYLNMVAGGFKNDLLALNDTTPHDRRYDRLIEYTTVIQRLLSDAGPQSFAGEFYTIDKLKMTPPLAPELIPGVFVSGSSDAGLRAARALRATAIRYAKPANEYDADPLDTDLDTGIRVGIVARDAEAEAWQIAHARFPEDRKGQLTHQLAMKVSDSLWHKQLSEIGEAAPGEESPYWLVPFKNYKTMCPYLVGSYDRVGKELAHYVTVGYRKFILDIPPDRAELEYVGETFRYAVELLNA
jgi:alkanesulfonate monooxygenase